MTALVDPNYADRRGFDGEFLGADLPLPGLADGVAVAVGPGATDGILRYHHFSVVMNPARRLAIFSAANVDGRRRFSEVRHADRWIVDPRMPDAQSGNGLYTANDLDRGHLTRRADMLWGDTAGEASAAVADTFHYTNCAPQHRDFNQNDTTWQGLEDYILVTVGDHRLRANVYTGPILDPDDPPYRGVLIPRAFWKVVAVATADRVHATAYLIEQTDLLDALGRAAEEPPLGAFRTYQTSVRHIESRTGVRFGPLHSYDPLEPPQGDAEEPTPFELHGLHDIKL
ncbi:DNA/RNA non-specific endonuclease [Asanoa sp. NPDC049573]|uniref:DNA/RNA non-specific endonuclease n=1 Tax=Asanoa sp. NPDC049573 TaxID=3155396 RepID=UPI003435CE18